jgi:VanZ family protein
MIAAAIFALSAQPTLPSIKGVLGWDKLQHFAAYAALAASCGLWASPGAWKLRRAACFFAAALIASVYGATDELHQWFVPGRDANVWDWLADTAGAFGGAGIAGALLTKTEKLHEKA